MIAHTHHQKYICVIALMCTHSILFKACLFNLTFYKASHSKGLKQRALHVQLCIKQKQNISSQRFLRNPSTLSSFQFVCLPCRNKMNGQTALMSKASSDCRICIQKLIECGADVNKSDFHDQTPLMIAARHAQNSSIEISSIQSTLLFDINIFWVTASPSLRVI